jgi:hypothetical protein
MEKKANLFLPITMKTLETEELKKMDKHSLRLFPGKV